jgi:putative redox protein
MKSEKLNFETVDGLMLSARLDMPVDAPEAFALFAHWFTCSKNPSAIGNISRTLTQAKIAVLRFDFTGLGESEGDFADTNRITVSSFTQV